MKRQFLLIACLFLLLFAVTGLCADSVPVYWQLSRIETDAATAPKYELSAGSDVTPSQEDDALAMMENVSGTQQLTLSAAAPILNSTTQTWSTRNAAGTYTISDIPVLVPGSSRANVTLSSEIDSSKYAFYLYSTLNAGGEQLARVRNSGSYNGTISFPAEAEPDPWSLSTDPILLRAPR